MAMAVSRLLAAVPILAMLASSCWAKGVESSLAMSPSLTMATLARATSKFSPVFSSLYFTPQSPAYYFMLNNLKAHNGKQFTLFYPTDSALKRYLKHQNSSPINCPQVPMRNNLAQQMVPGHFTAAQLAQLAQQQANNRPTGTRKNLLPTMSPLALSVLKKKPLMVGLLNNGYNRVISNATVVVADAVVTRTYVLHLIDNVLTACI